MGTDSVIINNRIDFEQYDGVKINYSNLEIPNSKFQIPTISLLFENDIKEQLIECFTVDGYKAFFKTNNSDFPFDIFAASFYLLSRYEEYLPHEKDMYGRYAHENSLAFKEGFLKLPLVNIWINDLAEKLKKKFSIFNPRFSIFNFIPTYDIDIAYSYKNKGSARNLGGALKSIATFQLSSFVKRIAVLTGTRRDPFDTFDWLDSLHQQYYLNPFYFFLVAKKNALYDKNILPHTKVMHQLVQRHEKKYSIGIHPSWQSGDDLLILKKEKKYLEDVSGKAIMNSRQHYIRFNLPDSYRRLINIGITNDYSMGYGSINGFRASVASPFYWFDLKKNEQTSLRIHSFCYMEANSYYEQKLSANEAYDEMMYYYSVCKEVNGTFICIWHNHSLGSDKQIYQGWNKVYKKFLNTVC